MKILITGGAGFIGSHLVEYHLKKGDIVYAIDDLSSGVESNIASFKNNSNFHFTQANILTWTEMDEIVSKIDRIYHMAAIVGVYKVLEEPEQVLIVNILGCEKLLQSVKKHNPKARVIIASSSEVYGPHTEELSETTNLIIEASAKNRWHYAVSKLTDESFTLAFHHKFNMSITAIRLFNTIGPRQVGRYGMVVPRFVKQAVDNKPITVFGSGNQTRSFCDVRDTVIMLDKLAENEKSIGEIINVGNDREITITDLALLVKALAKSDSEIQYIPYKEAYGENYVDIQRRKPNLTKLFTYIDFQYHWKLEDSIQYLISHEVN